MKERIKKHVEMLDAIVEELQISANLIEDSKESLLDEPYFKDAKKDLLQSVEAFARIVENLREVNR